MTNKFLSTSLALLFAGAPAAALAHTGQGGHGFMDGFTHPFLGADHLLAMLAVGAWSVLQGRRRWLAPIVFILSLVAGAILGQQGFGTLPLEPMVAASVLVLGVMLAYPRKAGVLPALALIGGFGVFHGVAHGSELSTGADVLAGIVAGSALLHASGIAMGSFLLKHSPQQLRRCGQLIALLGGGLVLSTVLG